MNLQKYMFVKSRGDAEQQEHMLNAFISIKESTSKLLLSYVKRLKASNGEKIINIEKQKK